VKGVNTAGILQMRKEGSPDAAPDSLHRSPDVSPRLAQLRRESNLTLSQVAQSTRLSTSFLSAIERGQANPSIAALQKLAELYKTSVLSFFDGEREHRKLVRPKDRRILNSGPGVQMELLAFGSTQMEAHLFRIAPRSSSGGSYHHKGEEFLYMLQGKLEIWLDEIERYVLESGDSLYFKSTQSHRWCSLTDRECVLLWVNTPPTF
jgi:transcriptional regulator with XRE-family HTH domain